MPPPRAQAVHVHPGGGADEVLIANIARISDLSLQAVREELRTGWADLRAGMHTPLSGLLIDPWISLHCRVSIHVVDVVFLSLGRYSISFQGC